MTPGSRTSKIGTVSLPPATPPDSYFFASGTSRRIVPSRLLRMKIWPSGPSPKRRSARLAGGLPCAAFFSLMSWSSVLGALVVEENAADRILSALRQLVGV